MKATFDRKVLLAAISTLSPLIQAKTKYPILGMICVRHVDAKTVRLVATDLETRIEIAIPAESTPRFAANLPAKAVKDLLRASKAAEVSITSESNSKDDSVSLDFGISISQLKTMPPGDFPILSVPKMPSFEIEGNTLSDLLTQTSFAISTSETRYYLRGIFLHVVGDTIRAVATDGHRLARQDAHVPPGAEKMPGVVIPTIAVNCLLAAKGAPSVTVAVSQSLIQFSWDGFVLSTKPIEGAFPDYERVTPKHNEKTVTFNADDMAQALSAVDPKHKHPVTLTFGGERIKVTLNESDVGSAETSFPASCDGFPVDLEIGFQSRYIADFIPSAGPLITLEIKDSGSPVVVKGRDGWLGIIMPKGAN